MPRNVFKPRENREPVTSQNPKTRQNVASLFMKRGLALSDHRDDVAFRTAKCRALKKLHTRASWETRSDAEKEAAEQEVIAELEIIRDAKKAAHQREWYERGEAGLIASEEEDIVDIEEREEEVGNIEMEDGTEDETDDDDDMSMHDDQGIFQSDHSSDWEDEEEFGNDEADEAEEDEFGDDGRDPEVRAGVAVMLRDAIRQYEQLWNDGIHRQERRAKDKWGFLEEE
jgi:hypothetical protein